MKYWSRSKIDLTGKRFGRWEVLQEAPPDSNGNTRWFCRCDCGATKIVYGSKLRDGISSSCGCFKKELLVVANTTHGYVGTQLYRTWKTMLRRHREFGVEMYPEWEKDMKVFAEWAISNGYEPGRHFLRFDTAKGYTPENCHWADRPNQAQGRKARKYITLNGETHSAAEWSRITGIPYQTIYGRITVGKPPEEILRK